MSKQSIAASVALGALMLAGSAMAQTAPPGAGAPISAADFQARYLTRMMRADSDHDGRISMDEWTQWRAAHPGRNPAVDNAAAFRRIDADHDGFLSADELKAAAAKAYERREARAGASAAPAE